MRAKKILQNSYMGIILFLIYIPIAVLILFAFNNQNSESIFGGFSTQWFEQLFENTQLWQSVFISVFVAIISTIISVIIGTLAALGMSRCRKVTRQITLSINNLPLVNADIVTAVGLVLLFGSLQFQLGIFTLLLSHISFSIPYVILVILPKTKQIQKNLLEASTDLGAKPIQTLFKVILPLLWPAILTGAVLAFASSFNDFVISFFAGGVTQNISTFLFTLRRFTPLVNAFSAVLVAALGVIVVLINIFLFFKNNKTNSRLELSKYKQKKELMLIKIKSISAEKQMKKMNKKIHFYEKRIQYLERKVDRFDNKEKNFKKNEDRKVSRVWNSFPKKTVAITAGIAALVVGLGVGYYNTVESDLTLAIWGGYIDAPSIEKFEQQTGTRLKVVTYSTNEELLSKLRNNRIDVVVPSDYAADLLVKENRVLKIPDNYRSQWGLDITDSNQQDDARFYLPLLDKMRDYQISLDDNDPLSSENLLEYQVPYFWGNIFLAYNPSSQVYQDVLAYDATQTDPNEYLLNSWNVLFEDGFGKVPSLRTANLIVSYDTRNVFLPAGMIFNNGNPNATELSQVQLMYDNTFPYVVPNRTRILADEAADVVADPNTDFDIAVMYNGDIVLANTNRPEPLVVPGTNPDDSMYTQNVREGTNVYEDGIVVLSDTPENKRALAWELVDFLTTTDVQALNSERDGYTAANFEAATRVINDNQATFPDYAPIYQYTINPMDQVYRPEFSSDFISSFNRILAAKQ